MEYCGGGGGCDDERSIREKQQRFEGLLRMLQQQQQQQQQSAGGGETIRRATTLPSSGLPADEMLSLAPINTTSARHQPAVSDLPSHLDDPPAGDTDSDVEFLPVSFKPGSWDVICQRGRENYDHGKLTHGTSWHSYW